MAKAYKCDRCGEYFESMRQIKGNFDISEIIAEEGVHYGNFKKDLCPVCQKEFVEWWNIER